MRSFVFEFNPYISLTTEKHLIFCGEPANDTTGFLQRFADCWITLPNSIEYRL